jgi:potassium/sodium efflux P-type ATPase
MTVLDPTVTLSLGHLGVLEWLAIGAGSVPAVMVGSGAAVSVGQLHGDPSVLGAAEVAGALLTDPARGLSAAEAARRLTDEGPNELRAKPPVPGWRKLLAQLRDPLVYLLLVAVAVSFAAWLVEGAHGVPFDVVVILAIVVANAVLGFVEEARAERAVEALARMTSTTATVIRDGEPVRVPTLELVRGDVIALAEGDSVSADARLVSATALSISEASLTGESEAVAKHAATLEHPVALADRTNMVWGGTAVVRGVGRAVVTATGMATQMGEVADLLQETTEDETPLQREIGRVGRMLGIAVVAIAVVVMATVFLTAPVEDADDVVTVLLLGVSLAVAAVPEGLPAILSVVLALGVQRMAAHRAIVKKLSSVETLGSASVICSDKTGTLTRSEMTLQRVLTSAGEAVVSGSGYRPQGRVEHGGEPVRDALREETARVLRGGVLASNAGLREENGDWVPQGDPTEVAFVVAERKLGPLPPGAVRVGEVPFSSERKLMSTVVEDRDDPDTLVVVTKGAPDVLLSRCSSVFVADQAVPLDEDRRARILGGVDRLSGEAFRTLAVGYRRLPAANPPPIDESLETDLTYAGTVGIIDPPRPEAAVAIAAAHRAGIRIIMITGDHPRTAARIAADLGIVARGATALTGIDLDGLDDDELTEAVRRTSVYARVAPAHKLRIVDALQADGEIVAMTGDGVNDAPALKSADIGIAMGITGTEVTKDAAKMVLADDNFATIVDAVREGRGIFDNIRKFLRYLLSSNMGEVLTVFLGVVLAGVIGLAADDGSVALPLLATQILWINLLTDTAPALAMGIDPETDDVMARPPRPMAERVIDAKMWTTVLLVGLVMAIVTLLTIDVYLAGGLFEGSSSLTEARTAGFTVLVLAQLFNCFNARSETSSAFHRMFVNPWLWGALALSLLLQIAVVHIPVLNKAFGTSPLSLTQWLVCLAMASAVLWADELRKVIVRLH